MSVRSGGGLSPVDVVIKYLFIKFLVTICFSISFELMKSNSPLLKRKRKKFFGHPKEKSIIAPTPGKIHLTPVLVCAVIIITPIQM